MPVRDHVMQSRRDLRPVEKRRGRVCRAQVLPVRARVNDAGGIFYVQKYVVYEVAFYLNDSV